MVKNLPANGENAGSIPGSERSSGGNGNPLQNSYLENSMDRRIWQVPWDHKELDTTEHVRARAHTHTHPHTHTLLLYLRLMLPLSGDLHK